MPDRSLFQKTGRWNAVLGLCIAMVQPVWASGDVAVSAAVLRDSHAEALLVAGQGAGPSNLRRDVLSSSLGVTVTAADGGGADHSSNAGQAWALLLAGAGALLLVAGRRRIHRR